MENTTQNKPLTNAVIIAAAIVISVISVAPALYNISSTLTTISTTAEKYAKNAAIDGCNQTSRVQTPNAETNQIIETPETTWYKICMKEKGY